LAWLGALAVGNVYRDDRRIARADDFRKHAAVVHAVMRAQVTRTEWSGTRWEIARRRPAPELAPYVQELQGYVEHAGTVVRRREFAGALVVVILEFEPRLRVYDVGQATRYESHRGGFVAGISDRFAWTEHAGMQAGIQLNLHPLAARRVFGLPLRELRERAVAFEDLVPEQRGLCEQLAELYSWDARFDRVEAFVRARLRDAPANDATVSWALQRIRASGGTLNLGELVTELGYSHKTVIARFHDQVGVPPKLWARLVRFERLRREIARGAPRSWAELASTCGYYDQAHLVRDVRQFTGDTPTALLRPGQLFQDADW
jgi:AraC-like DNA-binding protein